MTKRAVPMLLAVALLLSMPTLAYAAESEGAGAKIIYSETESSGQSSGSSGSIVSILSADGQESATATLPQLYPTEIKTLELDGETLIVKSYQVPEGFDVTRLTEPFESNGVKYEMREILMDTLPGETESKTVSKTVTIESESDDEDELLALFDESMEFEEDGYSGQLLLDARSIETEADETEPYRYLLTETREMMGMDRNDTYYIPKTACKNGVTLQLADVQWTPMGYGASGGALTPNLFSAKATYSGYATGYKPTSYIATATYTGQVQRAIEGDLLYSVVFGRSANQPLEMLEELNEPNEWGGTLLFILGAVVLVGGIGVGAWFIWKNRGNGPRPPKEKTKIYMPRGMEPEMEAGGAADV